MESRSLANVLVVCSLLTLTVANGQLNSTAATLKEFPWQASMVMDGANFCAGSIISSKWIITAGVCTDAFQNYVVTVGSLSSYSGTEDTRQLFLTTEYYQYPKYSGLEFSDNDISVIHLQQSIVYSTDVKPIRMPTYSQALESLVGMTVNASGWGLTAVGGNTTISTKLQYSNLTVGSDEVCYEAYGNVMISTKICVEPLTEEGNLTTTCHIDRGSPLVTKLNSSETVLVGIMSGFPVSSCDTGLSIIFTKVSSFLAFIEEKTDIAVGE